MDMLKKIVIRILLLSLVFFVFSEIYKSFYYEKDLQEYAPIMEKISFLSPSCKVLYLAESSNAASARTDQDKRRIIEMTNDYYPEVEFCYIDQGAFHAGNYRLILENIPETTNIETVVVTMNYRSFGAGWIYSNLETSLQKQMIFLHNRPPFINRLVLAFRAYPIKTDQECSEIMLKDWGRKKLVFPEEFRFDNVNSWDFNKWSEGILKEDGTKDSIKTEFACHLIKNYAFQLERYDNVRIDDFDTIVEIARKRNWNLVFNLLAENMMRAKDLVEPELTWLMNENKKFLINRYEEKGVMVVDNFDNIHDTLFYEREWPTEHYAEAGRKIIARNLADSLKTLYPEAYRPIE